MGWKEERLQAENNRCFMLKVVRMKKDTFKTKNGSILTLGSDH